MLDILDFFDIHVQKSIVTAVIYSCRQLTAAEFPKIKEILPNIRGLFGRSDAALVEGAANVVYRLLNSYVYKAEILEDILDRDMVDAISAALTPGSGAPQLSASVFANLLKVLTAGVRSSAKITLTLFEADFPRTIYFILTGLQPPDETDIAKGETAAPAEAVIMQTLSSRPKEVIEEILSLACELLPPPPKGKFPSALKPSRH
jgi:E3 ubiquitin-protein ligase TRIP12